MESEGVPMKSLKELYEKPYSLMMQFQSADFITVSEGEIPDDMGDGDEGNAGNQGW
jgi:hypothetical protein